MPMRYMVSAQNPHLRVLVGREHAGVVDDKVRLPKVGQLLRCGPAGAEQTHGSVTEVVNQLVRMTAPLAAGSAIWQDAAH